MKKIVILLWIVGSQLFGLEVGQKLPDIELSNDNGSYLHGNSWSSQDMNAKVNIIFYVDPDKKDLNDNFARELQKLHLTKKEMKVFVIINMKASWIPNVLIDSVLDSKQKKFPKAFYVKDNNRILIKKWTFTDNDYGIVAVDANHKVIFSHSGKMIPSLSKELIGEIKDELYNYHR